MFCKRRVGKYWRGGGFFKVSRGVLERRRFCHRRPLSTGGKDLQFLL